ncbi:aldo/keto reductase [Novosphingobium flavum]|uniref:Aldo/keto reductase n=1 Tax=Novosphingobium flavum TaxID=1778672 RepID=A0A7X1FPA4_9SPHN|nr:aldo/keto reductase [Novosphingobium flavum]MBC2664445.1 aldo/keto reductase [Novosphingobium flavum]
MIGRLIFGCGRLTGGASMAEALRLVDICLDAGIRHFDTAPSYGLGTAEAVIGKALRSAGRDVMITAKVGSTAPRFGLVKTWLRRAKRSLTAAEPRLSDPFTPVEAAAIRSAAEFGADAMRRSAERSAALLGRIDWLLLHESLAEHAAPETVAALDALAARYGALPGYSNGAQFDPATDAAYPDRWIRQVAVRPQWLTGLPGEPIRQPLSLHGIALTGRWLCENDAAHARRVEQAAYLVESDDQALREIAVHYALAASHLPQARLIVSSSHPGRLKALLAALTKLDPEQCGAITATFTRE